MMFSGLDLGQAKDNCALACALRLPAPKSTPKFRWMYHVNWLQVWELGTSYIKLGADLQGLYSTKELKHSALALDYSGVGRPVYDQLRAARVQARLAPVLTTGGKLSTYHEDTNVWNVPKADLAATLRALLEARLFRVEKSLVFAPRLETELRRFTVKITKHKNLIYEADASQHDDLVFACMLLVWFAERDGGGLVSGIGTPEPGSGSVIEQAPDGVFATPPEYHQSGGDRFGAG